MIFYIFCPCRREKELIVITKMQVLWNTAMSKLLPGKIDKRGYVWKLFFIYFYVIFYVHFILLEILSEKIKKRMAYGAY